MSNLDTLQRNGKITLRTSPFEQRTKKVRGRALHSAALPAPTLGGDQFTVDLSEAVVVGR